MTSVEATPERGSGPAKGPAGGASAAPLALPQVEARPSVETAALLKGGAAASLTDSLAVRDPPPGSGLPGVEPQGAVPERIAQSAKELKELIANLKAAGYRPDEFSVLKLLTVGADNERLAFAIFPTYKENLPGGFSHDRLDYPKDSLLASAGHLAEAAKDLLASSANERIYVPPYSLETEKAGQLVRVRVFDHLAKEPKVVVDAAVDPADKQALAQIRETVSREFDLKKREYRDALSDLPAAAPDSVLRTLESVTDQNLSPQYKENLSRLVRDFDTVTLRAQNPAAACDRLMGDFTLNADAIKEHPLRVRGVLSAISFNGTLPIKSISFNGEELKQVNGLPPFVSYVDKKGNVISRAISASVSDKPGDAALQTIEIRTPTRFSVDSVGRQVPVSFDLTELGYGKFEGGMSQQTVPRLDYPGTRRVYTSMDQESVKRDFGRKLPELEVGVDRAMKLYKSDAVYQVHCIRIADSNYENARFESVNLTTIVVQDEILRKRESPLYVAQHEAFHQQDGTYGFALSGGKFEQFFQKLSKDPDNQEKFFSKLDESNFLAGHGGFGGHSHQNPTELFATFNNSLLHPQFEAKMALMPKEFKDVYLEGLKALKETLAAAGDFPKDAPIFELLDRRSAELKTPLLARAD